MQSIIETKIDQADDQRKNQRSHQHQNGTALQFTEFRPRNLVFDFINRIEDITLQFFHLIHFLHGCLDSNQDQRFWRPLFYR